MCDHNGAELTLTNGDPVTTLPDVIAVPGNPLDDVATMERVFWVMKGGVVHRSDVEG